MKGELFIENEAGGITFSDGSRQVSSARPTWHRSLYAGRFELVLGGEAALDRETGLVWQKNTIDSDFDWYEAQSYCYNVIIGGTKGWRLPTINELSSLRRSGSWYSLPDNHPFTNVKSSYWSATTHAANSDGAWYINFENNVSTPIQTTSKSNDCYVRAVRAGSCAGQPAWDRIITDTSRFELVLNNKAVLDHETGLVWQREASDTVRTWLEAREYCFEVIIDGRMGWRMPTVYEMATLIDPMAPSHPKLPQNHPFINLRSDSQYIAVYWTSTRNPDMSPVQIISFYYGCVSTCAASDDKYVLAVRSGL